MAKSTRRPQQIFSIVMWLLSIIFAGFLIGLGSLIIRDIPRVDPVISVEDFIDEAALADLQGQETALENQLIPLRRTSEDAQQVLSSARADYQSARTSFSNWIATRNATEAASTNPEVLSRTQELELLNQRVRTVERLAEEAAEDMRQRERALSDVRTGLRTLRQEAEPRYYSAIRAQELRVFGFRLILTLPLLIMAGWMVARKRDSAYWPLYRGFVLFALFAFFIELVPYLPSYGGYVRYTVGIALVLICGYFLIKQMRTYLERKREEEARSEAERRQSIDYETALKKIAAKTCPGCDRSIVSREGELSNYCVHCGIHLQRECTNCGTLNITFYRFCLNCGAPNSETPGLQSATT